MKKFLILIVSLVLLGCTALEPTDKYKDPEFIHNERESGYSK